MEMSRQGGCVELKGFGVSADARGAHARRCKYAIAGTLAMFVAGTYGPAPGWDLFAVSAALSASALASLVFIALGNSGKKKGQSQKGTTPKFALPARPTMTRMQQQRAHRRGAGAGVRGQTLATPLLRAMGSDVESATDGTEEANPTTRFAKDEELLASLEEEDDDDELDSDDEFAGIDFDSLNDEQKEEYEIRSMAKNIAKRKRSNMYNENGVAYAPWMVNQIDDEAYLIAKELRKRRKKAEREAAAMMGGPETNFELVGDELSGGGLQFEVQGEAVTLKWQTGKEVDNVGFEIQRRLVRTQNWFTISTFAGDASKKNKAMLSKGEEGGMYEFTDVEAEFGEWAYRVIAVDNLGNKSVLCQAIVDVVSGEERSGQLFGIAALVLLGVGLAVGASLLDPMQ